MNKKRYSRQPSRPPRRSRRRSLLLPAGVGGICLCVAAGISLAVALSMPAPGDSSSLQQEISSDTGTGSLSNQGATNTEVSVGSVTSPAMSEGGADSSAALSQASSGAFQSDPEFFENTAFLGNSMIDDLYTYGLADGADFYFKTGLTVRTVFEETMNNRSVPVIDELKNGQYRDVFIMFGENELGWAYADVFIEEYGKVIDKVREYQPQANIYVHSIFPVSASASQRNSFGVNNERIEEYNVLLRQMCQDKGVSYLDVASVMKNQQGVLPEDAAYDGVHPNKEYCQKWVQYIEQQISKGES